MLGVMNRLTEASAISDRIGGHPALATDGR